MVKARLNIIFVMKSVQQERDFSKIMILHTEVCVSGALLSA
mgnify:FL=1